MSLVPDLEGVGFPIYSLTTTIHDGVSCRALPWLQTRRTI